MLTAPPPASRARGISRAAAATRSPATCSAGGRTGLPSFPALVVIGDQAIQQAHAIAGPPTVVDIGFRRAHRRACDIEMRPWRAVDEALQELRSRDRAGIAAAGVFHVGKLRVDQLVVLGAKRHAPDLLAGLKPGL